MIWGSGEGADFSNGNSRLCFHGPFWWPAIDYYANWVMLGSVQEKGKVCRLFNLVNFPWAKPESFVPL
jgi:hypothetical protein